MRVLVAEDERALADLVAEGLRRHAMAVDVAATALLVTVDLLLKRMLDHKVTVFAVAAGKESPSPGCRCRRGKR
jgi:DNA-binding response OmpR family regulator